MTLRVSSSLKIGMMILILKDLGTVDEYGRSQHAPEHVCHHKLSCLYSVKSIFSICDHVLVFNLVWTVVFVLVSSLKGAARDVHSNLCRRCEEAKWVCV